MQQRADQAAQFLVHSVRLHRAGSTLTIQFAEVGQSEGRMPNGLLRPRIELNATQANGLAYVVQAAVAQAGTNHEKMATRQFCRPPVRKLIRSCSVEQEQQLVVFVRVPSDSRSIL